MRAKKLQRVLEAHREWLNSGGKRGKRADLAGADLAGADIEGANLEGANLTGARLFRAHLANAHLNRANLKGANLEGANLFRAHLEGADIEGAHLEGADIEGAHLTGAHLESASLIYAHLTGANLFRAYLEGANLKGADLAGADLKGANLEGAHLEGANLTGANLSDAVGLLQAMLDVAHGDADTVVPAGLERPSRWLKEEAEEKLHSPSIPEPPLAPIGIAVQGDRLVLDDGAAESPAATDDLALHRQELLEEVQGLRQQPHISNHPLIKQGLARYEEGLGESLNAMQALRVGLRGLQLAERAPTVDNELSDDMAANYRALAVSHQIFMQRFPAWLEYIGETRQHPLPEQHWQPTQKVTVDVIVTTRQHSQHVEPRIPESMDQDLQSAAKSNIGEQHKSVFDNLCHLMVQAARLAMKTELAIGLFLALVKAFTPILEKFSEFDWVKSVLEWAKRLADKL